MSEKCFCHLNGYAVKDAEARRRIEALEEGGSGGSVDLSNYYTKNEVDSLITNSGSDNSAQGRVLNEIVDTSIPQRIEGAYMEAIMNGASQKIPITIIVNEGTLTFETSMDGETSEEVVYEDGIWSMESYRIIGFEGDIPEWVMNNSSKLGKLYLHKIAFDGSKGSLTDGYLKGINVISRLPVMEKSLILSDTTAFIMLVMNENNIVTLNMGLYTRPILCSGTSGDGIKISYYAGAYEEIKTEVIPLSTITGITSELYI